MSKILFSFVVFLLALKVATAVIYVNFPSNVFFADITRMTLINLTNQTRQQLGLPNLIESKKLDQAAYLKAQDMVQKEYFSHQSPEGLSPWYWFSKTGYNYKYAGENLAIGYFESQDVYNAWLNSPSHKENLLNPNYKEIGMAVLPGFGQNNAIVVVQLFGSVKTVAQKTLPSNKVTITQKTIVPEPKREAIKEVLSESIIDTSIILKDDSQAGKNDVYSRLLNFVSYGYIDYNKMLQGIVYIFWTAVIIMLFVSLPDQLAREHKNLLLRSLLIVVILSLATVVNENLMNFMVYYNITI